MEVLDLALHLLCLLRYLVLGWRLVLFLPGVERESLSRWLHGLELWMVLLPSGFIFYPLIAEVASGVGLV